ncbi:centrosomal protein of 162 kDa [Copidosoma floridanum]|uniref:centrosomal protein of 162 kDa n=1 Tax=Copidosoma floridanum TaxID=29053 RepID=UPI0006C9831E|nr:centrosomal protein of 162 kDa [Copidosoma floridanum]
MSEYGRLLSHLDDTISTEEDLPGSSLSFSIGDNSVHVKEKPKPMLEPPKEPDPPPVAQKKDQWWLKKPAPLVDKDSNKKEVLKKDKSPVLTCSATSSMQEFLDKEKMCKNAEEKDKHDKLQDLLSAVASDKYHSESGNATDDEIGSILEEMSKIAGAMSPIAENIKSKTINEILSDEQSVEELIQEAEKLVQQNNNEVLEKVLTTTTVDISDDVSLEGLTKVKEFEANIFQMIDRQVNEKISETPEKKTSANLFVPVAAKKLDSPQKKFDDQIVEVSSNSDVDEPIEKHSISENINDEKKAKEGKENLKKEITDVDKDFFDDLIKKTKESVEQLSSRSSSIADQEDFTNFLKLLQEQSDKEPKRELTKTTSLNLIVDQFDPLKESPEKKENQEKELRTDVRVLSLDLGECMRRTPSRNSSRASSKRNSVSSRSCAIEAKKVVSDNTELYTVSLTPRLELFADAIPKLLAEKSNEEKREMEKSKSENEASPKSGDNEDFSFKNLKSLKQSVEHGEVLQEKKTVINVRDYQESVDFDNSEDANDFNSLRFNTTYTETKKSSDHLKTERVISAPENRYVRGQATIGKSRSYDQLSKNLSKTVETKKPAPFIPQRKPLVPKPKVQPKTTIKPIPKTRPTTSKMRKEPLKPYQTDFSFNVRGNQIKYEETPKVSFGGGDWKGLSGVDMLEMLYQEERERFLHMKSELDAEIETYKCKLRDVQMLHEQEMFSLKKQNILLKAKLDELTQMNKKAVEAKSKYDPKIMTMQKELEKQENFIIAYESENKKLVLEIKRLQGELKSAEQQKPKIIVANSTNKQEVQEKWKDLQEENVKYNIEVSDLRQKNSELSLKCEDATQQNLLLQEELEMIKDQLRAKNDFITDRLQTMTTNELELRKEVEDLKVDLHSKTEQLKLIKVDYDRFQQSVEPLERELVDLRSKCTLYQEKLQVAKNNCEREKQLTQKLKDQVILDNKNIMDLNRQVREMERILKRKNPDSVSALILTANSENEKLNVEKVKFLEDRIAFLECEIRSKEDVAQAKLLDIQKKFTDMKDKYSTQVLELEQKMKTSPRDKKAYSEAGTQTMHQNLESRNSEPNLSEKLNGNRIGLKSQNLKEDIHLIATIRGLKIELTNKDKIIAKVNKDLQEMQKTNRKLQKEREKLLNERKTLEKANKIMTSSDSKLTSLKMVEGDSNSNFYHNGPLANGKRSSSMQKLYDQTQISDNVDTNNKVKKLTTENEVLKEEVSRLNKDFMALKNKRLQDLNLLQEEHEKEIDLIVKEYNINLGDTKALKLQGQVNSQMAMISHLKQQIEKLQDYKEQIIILKAERDHLESKNRQLNDKVQYLSTPSSQQLQLLQDKISILQQRHETRELSLQKLVRDLLRSRSQGCRDCKNTVSVGDKDAQKLCYFRQELDNILGTLQDLTSP